MTATHSHRRGCVGASASRETMSSRRKPTATACARKRACSFRKQMRTWGPTASSETHSRCPISRLTSPSEHLELAPDRLLVEFLERIGDGNGLSAVATRGRPRMIAVAAQDGLTPGRQQQGPCDGAGAPPKRLRAPRSGDSAVLPEPARRVAARALAPRFRGRRLSRPRAG